VISKAGVWASELLGGNVDGTCLSAGTVAGEGSEERMWKPSWRIRLNFGRPG
jgi:hypothetical protein